MERKSTNNAFSRWWKVSIKSKSVTVCSSVPLCPCLQPRLSFYFPSPAFLHPPTGWLFFWSPCPPAHLFLICNHLSVPAHSTHLFPVHSSTQPLFKLVAATNSLLDYLFMFQCVFPIYLCTYMCVFSCCLYLLARLPARLSICPYLIN